MGHYRKIDTRMWTDEKFITLNQKVKLFYIYLLTSPHSTAWGAYVINDLYIQADIGFTPKEIETCWKELANKKLIVRDKVVNLVCFLNWFKYNLPANEKSAVCCMRGILDLPKCAALSIYCEKSEWVSEQLAKRKLTVSYQEDNEQEQEQEQEQDIEILRISCPLDAIVESYHSILPMLPKVRIVNGNIERYLTARWKEDTTRQRIEWWESYFSYVAKSPHLLGGNQRGWKADLEWIVKKENFAKIANGRYHSKGSWMSDVAMRNAITMQEWLKEKGETDEG